MKKQRNSATAPRGSELRNKPAEGEPSPAALEKPTGEQLHADLDRELKEFLLIAKLEGQINEDLTSLKAKALRGDGVAIKTLYYLAAHSTEALNEVAAQDASIVRPLARGKQFWPMLTGPYESVKTTERQFFKRIQLGTSPSSISAQKLFARYSVARETAVMLVSWVDALRRMATTRNQLKELDATVDAPTEKHSPSDALRRECATLPGFSAQTVDKWYPVCKKFLEEVCEGHPERVPSLRQIGLYRAKHTLNKAGTATAQSQEANIRDGLFTQIKRAMKAVAQDP